LWSNPWFNPQPLPLVYRPIREWQQLAQAGSLRPHDQLYDPVRGMWQRAYDYPQLRQCFPAPSVNWGAAVGLAALAFLAVGVSRALTNDLLRGLRWEDLKREIFRRDDYTCQYCGHRGNVVTLHVDHLVPASRGGTDDPSNLVTACWSCNLEKGNRTGWEYRFSRLFNGR
jgi:hypothetical protein